MNIKEIKGPYDVIVSLGSECTPALQLRRSGLRNFSGPLDWFISSSLADVNQLLNRRFEGFMQIQNMRLIEGVGNYVDHEVVQPIKSYYVQDTISNIISVHDFPVTRKWIATYPSFKNTVERRINRFLEKIDNGRRILFVRRTANYKDAKELQLVLSKIVKNQFNVLIVNPISGLKTVKEKEWGLKRVCVFEIPLQPRDLKTWDYLLNGITLIH